MSVLLEEVPLGTAIEPPGGEIHKREIIPSWGRAVTKIKIAKQTKTNVFALKLSFSVDVMINSKMITCKVILT